MKILIADDDPVTRGMLESLLKKFGHRAVVCRNGEEARGHLFRPDAPPLALLDWVMPAPNGLELVRELRRRNSKRIHLILLTGRGKSEDRVKGLDAGADDYIVKPIEPGELRARIQAGIRIVEMQERLDRKIGELQAALSQIRTLEGILPICAHCKKIRDDRGAWEQVEVYVRNHSEAQFSHSVCPDCMQEHYPDLMGDEGRGAGLGC